TWLRFVLSAAGVASLLLTSTAPAAVPIALMKATCKAATAFATGQAAAVVCSTQVAGLIQMGLRTMSLTKIKITAALLLASGLLIAGAAGVARELTAAGEQPAPPTNPERVARERPASRPIPPAA